MPYNEPPALTLLNNGILGGPWENSSGIGGSCVLAPNNYLEFLGLEPGPVLRVEMQGGKATSTGENRDSLFQVMKKNIHTQHSDFSGKEANW